ncbi:uncharacterized protein LOC105922689 [Fundulus heteroclitus]|uniref:uncharacterized protein LOC105922689 n=1 Tax=Fundulus heteroclitus TaxID=8078 RepID=UPI00165C77F6|nr:uncharacterized protein LOC105922689 [Fundulus heteroclitus]
MKIEEEIYQMEIEEQKNHQMKVENPDMKNHMIKNEENHVKLEENDVAKVEEHQEKFQDQEPDHLNTTNQTNQAASSGPSDLQMHQTILRRGQDPLRSLNRCTVCCDNFHCYFCRKTFSAFYKVKDHIENHERTAVKYEDMSIIECNLGCREVAHFHCYHCKTTVLTPMTLINHLGQCKKTQLSAKQPEMSMPLTSTSSWAVSTSQSTATSAAQTPPASTPPVPTPPASTPPVPTPPASAPPVPTPPASAPPVPTPPASAPLVPMPPASAPPASTPSVPKPPASTPSVPMPPASAPPTSTPSVPMPPASAPPTSTPPVPTPPASTPPVSTPPVPTPPASTPSVPKPPASKSAVPTPVTLSTAAPRPICVHKQVMVTCKQCGIKINKNKLQVHINRNYSALKTSDNKNRRCPLCGASLTHLGKHLKGLHKVSNAEEKHILVKLGSRRISIRECPCPVPGCAYASGKHLDRHLGCYHSELSERSRSRMTERARFLLAIDQLAKLRATDPSPPMVSTLDLEDPPQATRDEPLAEDTTEEQVLDHEECRRALARSREEVNRLGRETAALRARVRQLSLALTAAKRAAASARKGPTLHSVELRTSSGTDGGQGGDAQQSTSDPSSSSPSPVLASADSSDPSLESPAVSPASSVDEEEEEEEEEMLLKSQKTDRPHRPTVTGDLLHRLVLPRSVETCIDRYRKYFTYKYGSRKMNEGISRLRSFLRFMAEGHTLLSSWTFLYNPGRINRWIKEMTTSGKEVATVHVYVHQISQFIRYIRKNRPRHCRLSNRQTACILKILEKAKKDSRQAYMLHQNQRRRAETMPEPESILKCIRVAPAFIEGTLDELEKDLGQTTLRYELYGYLTAYWACTSGHRPGVFINMQDSEVDAAARKQTSWGVLIRVAEHETSSQCGEATLALTEREFSWVRRLRNMKKKLCVMNKFLLFTLGKLPFRNIIRYLNVAWSKMGLGGTVNFTLIRTALADSAKSQLTVEERTKVSSFMCDDTKTAGRFSVLHPSLQEAIRIRTLMTEALSRVASPEQPSTSSAARTGARKAKRRRTEEEWCSSETEEESKETMEEESEEAQGMGMRSPTKPLIIPCSVKISPLKIAELRL